MSPRFLSLFSFLLPLIPCLAADFPTPTNNQEVTNLPLTPPDKTIGMMHLPPGFKATLFAAEPDIQQPIAMTWDEKGRLWVAENYTYSDGKERFDLKLKDRILIFEDTDNDGHFDKRTVFHDDLQMLTSIERGFGGVYALCPPHLLFIPTKDDKPTGPPQVILDGFSTTAASRHTFANGLKWGPDGWLYGRVGISSTSWVDVPGTPQDKRKPTAGGIWRYHPTRKIYEPFCHGTTNPWGMDWDEHGEMFFINTVIGHLWHGIQGAHFKRMHGEDPYDHIYGLIDQHADHYHWDTGKKWSETRDSTGLTDTLGGGHAHVGMMIYQGTNFPKEYRGKVFTTNLHGHRVNIDRLEREGSGYVGKHEPDFMKTDDPWFRATEIQYGPDGGVYILDWSDIGECHEADGVHRTSGRIYKITYGDPTKPKESDMTKLSDEELVKLQLSDNEWLVRMARWELRERAWKGKTANPNFISPAARPMYDLMVKQGHPTPPPQPSVSFPLIFLGLFLEQIHEINSPDADKAFSIVIISEASQLSEYVQAVAVHQGLLNRSLVSIQTSFAPESDNTKAIKEIAVKEKSPLLRLAWSSALQRLPTVACVNCACGLLSHAEDATDHNLPLMYWFGIRDLPSAELVKLVKDCRIPLVTQFIARRITEEIDKDPAPLNELLSSNIIEGFAPGEPSEGQSAIVAGMTDALKGWRKAKKPADWDRFAAALAKSTNAAMQKSIRDLNVLFGDGRALDEVRAIALDDKANVDARRSALRTLIEAKSPDTRKICEKLLGERSLSLDAAQGLATFDDPALAEMIVKRWRSFYANEHGAVISALASRPSFAKVLLKHIGEGGIERSDITPVIARQIRSFNDPALTKQLAEVWGEARESSEDKKKLMAELRAKLTPEFIAKGDQSRGRLVFSQVCATCHKLYGEGNLIGPDLTGSGRHDVGYLIENIADPSAVVAADFTLVVVTLKDGRVLSGIVSARTEQTLTVKMIGMETTVDKSEIVKQEQLPISMMPEGLLTALKEEQVRDLVSYLMSNGQVPLPK
jgi:putative membrane-bound dehydrogenase-like protein